jgi:hypothetical protein
VGGHAPSRAWSWRRTSWSGSSAPGGAPRHGIARPATRASRALTWRPGWPARAKSADTAVGPNAPASARVVDFGGWSCTYPGRSAGRATIPGPRPARGSSRRARRRIRQPPPRTRRAGRGPAARAQRPLRPAHGPRPARSHGQAAVDGSAARIGRAADAGCGAVARPVDPRVDRNICQVDELRRVQPRAANRCARPARRRRPPRRGAPQPVRTGASPSPARPWSCTSARPGSSAARSAASSDPNQRAGRNSSPSTQVHTGPLAEARNMPTGLRSTCPIRPCQCRAAPTVLIPACLTERSSRISTPPRSNSGRSVSAWRTCRRAPAADHSEVLTQCCTCCPARPACCPLVVQVRLSSSRSSAQTYGAAYGLPARVAVRKHPAYRWQNPCSRRASAGIAAGLPPQRPGSETTAVESRRGPCSDAYHNGARDTPPRECEIVNVVTKRNRGQRGHRPIVAAAIAGVAVNACIFGLTRCGTQA